VEKLEQLARRQSEVLEKKLGGGSSREIPTRPLPFGSEGVMSPTYVQQKPPSETASTPKPATTIKEPSFRAGPLWEKDETFPPAVRAALPTEEERDVLET
jgi:glycogenin glucosyltransferase